VFWGPVGAGMAVQHPDGGALLELLTPGDSDQPRTVSWVEEQLLNFYRQISRRRLADVIDMLGLGTSRAMRPAEAGLLFFLLVNRNTSPDRSLPRFPDRPEAAREVVRAISDVVRTFARELGASASDMGRAVDLYRGWAFGELARRLGSDLQSNDEGLYVRDEDGALERLISYLRSRPKGQRNLVPTALRAAVAAYIDQRPSLSSMGLAFDRPALTDRLVARLTSEATGEIN